MILYYLDASAWVKRYYREPGTLWIQQLFEGDAILACATIGLVEVAATLARKGKGMRIDQADLKRKSSELSHDWRRFTQIHLTAEVLASSRVAAESGLRGADAIHLASARVLSSRLSIENDLVVLVTADVELKLAAEIAGIAVLDPANTE